MKKRPNAVDPVAWAILGSAAIVAVLLPDSLLPTTRAAAPPDQVRLTGVVRDFRATHPDFDLAGTGLYGGTVDHELGPDGRPVFNGSGFEVTSPWYDDAGREIPSLLYRDSARPRLAVASEFIISGSCFVDSFDSTLGPYGAGNVGSSAALSVDSTAANAVANGGSTWIRGDVLIGGGGDPSTVVAEPGRITGTVTALPQPIALPVVELPTDVGPYLGDFNYDGETVTIDSNRHWGHVRMVGTVLDVHGDRVILVNNLDIDDTVNNITFQPGASLEIYCTGWMEIDNDARINMDTGIPSQLTIYMMGTFDGSGDEEEIGLLDIEDGAQVTADIVAPAGKMLLENGCDVYGTFVGQSVEITADSRVHVDLAVHRSGCGSGDGAAGSLGAAGTGSVDSAASFAGWFTNTMGTNLAANETITLTRDGAGVYEYLDDAFYPVDGELFGNESGAHNNHFTYTLDAEFVFSACSGQFIEFEGGDGAWLFVDGRLVMDLGGLGGGASRHIELDRLGLTDGATSRVQLFYASRRTDSPVFRLRTNVELSGSGPVALMTAPFD